VETYAIKAPLEGVRVIGIKYTRDERGFFIESYHQQRFAEVGIEGGYRVAHR
jgi:dTDP-4-dehydrorhamnose 3,5-epimerase